MGTVHTWLWNIFVYAALNHSTSSLGANLFPPARFVPNMSTLIYIYLVIPASDVVSTLNFGGQWWGAYEGNSQDTLDISRGYNAIATILLYEGEKHPQFHILGGRPISLDRIYSCLYRESTYSYRVPIVSTLYPSLVGTMAP